jgi:catechol 2,3-dioxygenase-like lactoylglutathione lyase family enzyme
LKFGHINIVAKDWKKLAKFYKDVFDCKSVPPERNLKGEWLDKGTGLREAHLMGMHLRLPGYDENGPTLEIYEYSKMKEKTNDIVVNRPGYGHIAFQVDNVEEALMKLLENGGKKMGEVSKHYIDGAGELSFVYATDIEGNIIEIQNWN